MFLGCSPGFETKEKNQVNTSHEKNNQKIVIKNLPIKLSTAK